MDNANHCRPGKTAAPYRLAENSHPEISARPVMDVVEIDDQSVHVNDIRVNRENRPMEEEQVYVGMTAFVTDRKMFRLPCPEGQEKLFVLWSTLDSGVIQASSTENYQGDMISREVQRLSIIIGLTVNQMTTPSHVQSSSKSEERRKYKNKSARPATE